MRSLGSEATVLVGRAYLAHRLLFCACKQLSKLNFLFADDFILFFGRAAGVSWFFLRIGFLSFVSIAFLLILWISSCFGVVFSLYLHVVALPSLLYFGMA